MFWTWFLFIFIIAVPMLTRAGNAPGHLLRNLLIAGGAALTLAIYRKRLGRLLFRGDRRPVLPSDADAATLKWPGSLGQARLEAYCTVYLRQAGWQVEAAQARETDGIFLDAVRGDVRVLLQCSVRGAVITPPGIRALALAVGSFSGARPAILAMGKVAPAAAQAAAESGVELLTMAMLPHLAERAAATLPPPPPE